MSRYVTVQRYRAAYISDSRLRVAEVEIILFCELDDHFIPDGMCPIQEDGDDMEDCQQDQERGSKVYS